MSLRVKRSIEGFLRVFVVSLFIGLSLYIYNDYRHSQAAAQSKTQSQPAPVEVPNRVDADGVTGTIEVGPDGKVRPKQ